MARLRREPALANLEELAEIGVVLVRRNLGERFLALFGGGQIKVATVPAGMEIGSATGTGVSTAHLIAHDFEGATTSRAAGHCRNISEKPPRHERVGKRDCSFVGRNRYTPASRDTASFDSALKRLVCRCAPKAGRD